MARRRCPVSARCPAFFISPWTKDSAGRREGNPARRKSVTLKTSPFPPVTARCGAASLRATFKQVRQADSTGPLTQIRQIEPAGLSLDYILDIAPLAVEHLILFFGI